MGIDPKNPNYDPGNDCVVCNASLFGGITPLYVEANISGNVDCPGPPPGISNGVFLLPQFTSPCVWTAFFNGWLMTYTLGIGSSQFLVQKFGQSWFFQTILLSCQTDFINTEICGIGFAKAAGGECQIHWGPTIGP